MKDLRRRLLATFQVEHREHLKCIRDILAKTAGALPAGDIDEVFRRVHSLKGAARAVGVAEVENLAHRLETLFSRARSGAIALDLQIIAVVHQALDSSEDVLVALSENRSPGPPTKALDAIEKVLGLSPAVAAAVPEPVGDLLPAGLPSFEPIETVRLIAENLDRLVNSAGQLSTENLRQDLLSQKLRDIDKDVKVTLAEQSRSRMALAEAFRNLNSNEELAGVGRYIKYLEHQTHLLSDQIWTALQLHDRNSWALRSLTSELQTEVRQARMAPADSAFEGFPKMIRDLARDEKKQVEFQIMGNAVEADRLVLQALKDPLMHILRNALSHGIESDEERKRKGKSEASRIQLKIEAHGNRLDVTVEDNGRGLDLARISEVAVHQGLISQAKAASESPEEMARLVFLPGFSTARSVTEVSGRGMGLSVVAEAITRLQGKTEIQPREGGGTRISISVPLSISSHRLLLVLCQSQTFAIPLHGVEKLCRIPLKDLETIEGKAVVRFKGRHISLVTLAHVLNVPEAAVSADKEVINVAILRLGEKRLAVAVDAFLSEREASIKELPGIVRSNTKMAGGILLEDGSVCLVLNPAEVVRGLRQSSGSLVIAPVKTNGERSARILIVDDSLTTRTLEKSILESHGYEVSVAIDGQEALTWLQSETVGLVITDVEMPRMDGFALLREMKNDPRLASIPVIIVSSLENREHQERGLALGADAYVVKRRFEQQELLDTIEQIL